MLNKFNIEVETRVLSDDALEIIIGACGCCRFDIAIDDVDDYTVDINIDGFENRLYKLTWGKDVSYVLYSEHNITPEIYLTETDAIIALVTPFTGEHIVKAICNLVKGGEQ